MDLTILKKQISKYEQDVKQLEQLNKIAKSSEISGIIIRNDSTLQNVFLDNPQISADDKQAINALILMAIEDWKEELKIDVQTFENSIAGVK